MEQIAVLQYKRGPKRLQIILFPWSARLTSAALFRIWDQHTLSYHHGWRSVPGIAGQITLALDETTRFVADVGVEEVLRSPWINNGAKLEIREIIDLEPYELVDLQTSQPINSLLDRIPTKVDNWA